jgi:hypothetical protein
VLKASKIEIGSSMALAIEHKSGNAFVIGINTKGELGVGDQEVRKSFFKIEELNNKVIEEVAIGKSGFVVAIGSL